MAQRVWDEQLGPLVRLASTASFVRVDENAGARIRPVETRGNRAPRLVLADPVERDDGHEEPAAGNERLVRDPLHAVGLTKHRFARRVGVVALSDRCERVALLNRVRVHRLSANGPADEKDGQHEGDRKPLHGASSCV